MNLGILTKGRFSCFFELGKGEIVFVEAVGLEIGMDTMDVDVEVIEEIEIETTDVEEIEIAVEVD